jgi:hypothetical protein
MGDNNEFNPTREDVAGALMHLGIEITRSWNFARNKSFSISKTGLIKDFGSTGFSGDLINYIMHFENLPFKEAKIKAHELCHLPMPDFSKFKQKEVGESAPISDDIIDAFMQEAILHSKRHGLFLKYLLPGISLTDRATFAINMKIGYSKMADRLIMPVYNVDGTVINLWKYTPIRRARTYAPCNIQNIACVHKNKKILYNTYDIAYNTLKVKYTKNRMRVPLLLDLLIQYRDNPHEIIYFVEGEKDFFNLLARGYRVITLGGASMRIREEHISLFKGLHIHIMYDYDDAGVSGTIAIYNQLKEKAQKITITDWFAKQKREHFTLKKGYDSTDYLTRDIEDIYAT